MGIELRTALLAALAWSSSATAFTLTGAAWSWQADPIAEPFYVNPTSFPSTAGSVVEIRDALEDGMRLWNDEGQAGVTLRPGGDTTLASISTDGTYVAHFHAGSIGGFTIAQAVLISGPGGEATECDIRFYDSNTRGPIAWSADPAGASVTEWDLEYTAIHEFGHCLGLDHSLSASAIMFGSSVTGNGPADRHLTRDDIDGLQAMYGTAIGADLELTLLDPPIAGQAVRFVATGASPAEIVRLAWSPTGEGAGPCPAALGGACSSLLPPIAPIAQETADLSGRAVFRLTLPNGAVGRSASFQAAVIAGVGGMDSRLSNPLSTTVLPASTGCPVGEVPDCAAACYPAAWIGDGSCDNGRTYQWGSPDFDCSQFTYDQGDCP